MKIYNFLDLAYLIPFLIYGESIYKESPEIGDKLKISNEKKYVLLGGRPFGCLGVAQGINDQCYDILKINK